MPLLNDALIAGFIAISVNTLLLQLAPMIHIKAEGGGLLKLLLQYGRPITGHIAFLYTSLFGVVFHYLTGLVMVIIYICWFSRLLKMSGWIKGSLFSLLPWLINGFIVLPLLGYGLLGNYKLSLAGMCYFMITNWLFGLVLGWLFAYLNKSLNK
ncbi:hypothetical protein [Mucilaginibacter agri]|uniref:Uncharacterized protein n=2 Tax=Mucilaginibacter TaxID=423349 RepID=A0A965ZB46_9SPHI|nr:hypothetical protein [Mucilaginibacter agri]NCD67788.1 hypothetical protein [Mucilaginibacter agri]